MALPQTEADWKRAAEAIRTVDITALYRPQLLDRIYQGPPKLKSWPNRLWCAVRGHGGISPLPGQIFYFDEGLCKRCGARVKRS